MTLVNTPALERELRGRLLKLHRAGWPEPIGFDVETFGPEFKLKKKGKPDFTRARICGFSIAFVDGARYYVPVRHPEQRKDSTGYIGLDYEPCEARWKLLNILLKPEVRVWAHNAKAEIAALHNEGIKTSCQWLDSEIASWMAGWKLPGKGGLKLKELARVKLGHKGPDFQEVARGRQSNEVPEAEMAGYAADDAWLTLALGQLAYKRVVELDSVEHFKLEMRCVPVTEHMERTGVSIDRAYLLAEADRCEAEANRVAAEFEALTKTSLTMPVKVRRPKACPRCEGTAVVRNMTRFFTIEQCPGDGRKSCMGGMLFHRNGREVMETVMVPGTVERGARIGSDADVSRWLFQELKWWTPNADHPKVDYGYSVKEEFIRRYSALPGKPGEACRLRLRYQALRKYASTYTRSLVELADQAGDGKLHTGYKQDGTDTARYSSSMPNISNLPQSKRQPLPWMHSLPDIRKAFLARPGWVVVIFDFSQIELRLVAHYSKDEQLMLCYQPGSAVDVHERTRIGMGDNAQRKDAKVTNFSTVYRISAQALARKLALGSNDFETYNKQVAQNFIDSFYDTYPKVTKYHSRAISYAEDNLFATSLTGFKRPIKGWNSFKTDEETGRRYSLRGSCERKAVNSPIQASAGGILKRALVGMYERWGANRDKCNPLGPWLGEHVAIMGQTYDEIIVECTPEVLEFVRADMKSIMEGAAPELRVPLVAEGGVGPSWSEAK